MNRLGCRTLRLSTVVVGLLLLGSSGAAASTGGLAGEQQMDEDVAEEDVDDHDEMLQLSAEGNELYADGHYEEAAELYQQAYETYPQPILLKNQMITRYLIEECERAVELGEQFLEAGEPDAQDEEDVEAVFGECSIELAEQAVEQEQFTEAREWLEFGDPHLFEEPLREDADRLRERIAEHTEEPEDDEQEVEPVDDPGAAPMVITGGVLAGVGAVTLVSAGMWHASWEADNARLQEMENDPDVDLDQLEQEENELNERYQTVSWAVPTMYGAGAALALAGTGLMIWPMVGGGDEPAASIRPQIGDGAASAVFTLSF